MNRKTTVFLVDDDATVRDALSLFLEASGLVVSAYASAREFLRHYQPSWPGCMVLDIRMPGMTGLELQKVLKQRQIEIPIIFLTGHGDIPMSVKALKGGAVDFIEKPFKDEVLLDRIREAIAIDAHRRKITAQKMKIMHRYVQLTRREKQVLTYVISGLSNKEIAKKLHVSHRTIDVHRARIMNKMEASSLPELVNLTTICDIS